MALIINFYCLKRKLSNHSNHIHKSNSRRSNLWTHKRSISRHFLRPRLSSLEHQLTYLKLNRISPPCFISSSKCSTRGKSLQIRTSLRAKVLQQIHRKPQPTTIIAVLKWVVLSSQFTSSKKNSSCLTTRIEWFLSRWTRTQQHRLPSRKSAMPAVAIVGSQSRSRGKATLRSQTKTSRVKASMVAFMPLFSSTHSSRWLAVSRWVARDSRRS